MGKWDVRRGEEVAEKVGGAGFGEFPGGGGGMVGMEVGERGVSC